jgi:adenylate kinase
VFRNLNADSRLGRVFLEYSSRGELVPDEATVDLWRNNIQANTMLGRFNPERDTLVLDGIPRNAAQAEMLKNTLDVRALLHLTCPDRNKMVERLQRRALRDNRLDDANLEVIRNRLQVYDQETKPVLDYYGPEIVHSIDAAQSPIEVLRDILRVVAKL